MKFLRTAPTSRLLAVIVGLAVAAGAGTAIAVAAAGQGAVPAAKPLSVALHNALAAPAVTGISADISFTNNLIASTNFTGGASDPILQGAHGRLWLSNDHRMRLELQSSSGDAQIVVSNGSFWISDPSMKTVYLGTLPAELTGAGNHAATGSGLPTVATIQSELSRLMQHVDVSGATPSNVAGQGAYTVTISPKHSGGMLGSAQLAWDAIRGVPLRVAVYARGNPTPVLELKATNISYGPVSASNFTISPPAGSKVVKISTAGQSAAGQASAAKAEKAGKSLRHHGARTVSAVAASLPFKLVAPATLVNLPRHTVQRLDWGGKPAALVTYGENLGGIVVIEQAAAPGTVPTAGGQSSSPDQRGLSLPTVSINGATGQELDTALGTVVRFTRGGVAYTVLGSVPAVAADAAARAL